MLTALQNYQQPIDITIGENEKVFFVVSGTHSVWVTGNYVIADDEDDEDDSDDEEYDLPPDMDSDDMSDELDELDGAARVEEIDTDEEEAPKLVKADKSKKGKKRPAEEESLDEIIAQDDKKLSKKQLKKLKTNEGAAAPDEEAKKTKESPAKADKKVQFAKNLEQGPTGPAKEQEKKAAGGVKVVQGVTIDDRKVGTGRTAKSGDRVGMRYIGKLQNGKVFDCK